MPPLSRPSARKTWDEWTERVLAPEDADVGKLRTFDEPTNPRRHAR